MHDAQFHCLAPHEQGLYRLVHSLSLAAVEDAHLTNFFAAVAQVYEDGCDSRVRESRCLLQLLSEGAAIVGVTRGTRWHPRSASYGQLPRSSPSGGTHRPVSGMGNVLLPHRSVD